MPERLSVPPEAVEEPFLVAPSFDSLVKEAFDTERDLVLLMEGEDVLAWIWVIVSRSP